jgi:hypothetical protein
MLMLKKFEVRCYFCGEKLTENDLPVRKVDNLTIHHLNHNHLDNRVENLVLVHRKCHKAYHMRMNHVKGGEKE